MRELLTAVKKMKDSISENGCVEEHLGLLHDLQELEVFLETGIGQPATALRDFNIRNGVTKLEWARRHIRDLEEQNKELEEQLEELGRKCAAW